MRKNDMIFIIFEIQVFLIFISTIILYRNMGYIVFQILFSLIAFFIYAIADSTIGI